jgi:alpha-N-arabinofuranosidase
VELHNYTVVRFPAAYTSVGFGEQEYAEILQDTLKMDGLIRQHGAIMDKYDPEKKVALVVDEWGAWYAQLPGTTPGFLAQQNSVRDAIIVALNINIFARHADRVRMANIAQMVNVLQAMLLTDGPRMVRTPTYHAFRMYVPFQGATFVPVTFDAGRYVQGSVTLPRIDAMAARDASGTLWISLTNVDPKAPVAITTMLSGMTARSASGEVLTGAAIDSVNTFEAPDAVAPKPAAVTLAGNRLSVMLPPHSVTVVGVRP